MKILNPMAKYQDNLLLTVQPSHWVVAHLYLISTAIAFVFPPSLLFTLYAYFDLKCWKFNFSEQKILEKKGLFSIKETENYYFRIKSVTLDKPFLYRLVGLSILTIETSDYAKQRLVLNGITNGDQIRNFLYERIQFSRKKEGVREMDIFR
jgi:uncharacterized membrane protein YdbT with pleckstrin-like domain